jgi:ELWxxDGT repeat protein
VTWGAVALFRAGSCGIIREYTASLQNEEDEAMRIPMLCAILVSIVFTSQTPYAEVRDQANLVKDLSPEKGVENLTLVSAGDAFYFQNYDAEHGVELWRSNGTEAGSRMVTDVRPGADSSFPDNLTAAGPFLYFTAEDGVHGRGLWRTDGTDSGTLLVRGAAPGENYEYANAFVASGLLLYVTISDDNGSFRLWRTDGTTSGTFPITTGLAEGGMEISATPLPVASGIGSGLFFSAHDSTDYGLWRTDGSMEGTQLLRYVDPLDSAATMVGSRLFFWADDNIHGVELWASDGTPEGTGMVRDVTPGAASSTGTACGTDLGGLYVFSVQNESYSTDMWRSDGTSTGTFFLKSIGGSYTSLSDAVRVGSKLYLLTSFGGLWVTNGTETGTVPVGTSGAATFSLPERLTPAGDALFFFAATYAGASDLGYELWQLDNAGAHLVRDIWPGETSSIRSGLFYPMRMPVLGSTVFFRADDGVHGGALWKSDGTASGTLMLGDFLSASHSSCARNDSSVPTLTSVGPEVRVTSLSPWERLGQPDPYQFITTGTDSGTVATSDLIPRSDVTSAYVLGYAGQSYLVSCTDPEHGDGLWRSEGRAGDAVFLRRLTALDGYPSTDIFSQRVATLGGDLFFAGSESASGSELWRSDGTRARTLLVKDIAAGAASSSPDKFIATTTLLFFMANDGLHGRELWRSDGTASGTILVRDISPNIAESTLNEFTAVGKNLFFVRGPRESTNWSLWVSNGTPDGTLPVVQFAKDSYALDDHTSWKEALYFRMRETHPGSRDTMSLWRTDGVSTGTFSLISHASRLSVPCSLDSCLIIAVVNSWSGWTLLRSDGTKSGTTPIKSFEGLDVTEIWSSDACFMKAGGKAYFFAANPEAYGIWRTDGTAEGTAFVKQTEAHPYTSLRYRFCADVNGVLYYVAMDAEHGCELWRTDGTEAGTYMVRDIHVGEASSYPDSLQVSGTALFFMADDGIWGRELWKVTDPALRITAGRKEWSLYR